MKYLLAAASALLVASPALAHGPALGKRHHHHHRPYTGVHKHYHCHDKKDICHWHKHSHWGKDAGHHGKWFMHRVYPHRYYNDHLWYPGPSWEIHLH